MRGLLRTALITAAALASAPAALADSTDSSNWAGYAVHRAGVSFRGVAASWRQPSASCQPGHPTFSAMWVGLGGYRASANALEQVGTELDCARSGRALSSAWYELVPSASRPIRMRLAPGDLIRASVSVEGSAVSLAIDDVTRRRGFRRTVPASSLDLTSAEWIVEAPSDCSSAWACVTLPLANFGSAAFTGAQAESAAARWGPIAAIGWRWTRIRLSAPGSRYVTDARSGSASATATPSGLQARGSAFSVTYSRSPAGAEPTLATRRAGLRSGYLVHPGR